MAKALTFPELLMRTARQKIDAAKARNATDGGAEKPKEVILAACKAIADHLVEDGFAFRKSGPDLIRKAGDLTFRIHFQSDRNNVAGRRAAIWIHAVASSAHLAEWRLAHPLPWNGAGKASLGMISGGQIGNLLHHPKWMEWDFANPHKRQQRINDAAATIRAIILPFFALFDRPALAVDTLLQRPALRQTSIIEYALAMLGRDAATAAMHDYLAANPVIQSRYKTALAHARSHGPAHHAGDMAQELAAITLLHRLDQP